jgi:RILP-like protein 1
MVNFRRKCIVAQNQIDKMVKAKAELECSVTEKEHQLNLIKEKLHIKNIQIEDRSQYIEDESKQQRRISNLSTINTNNLNEITTTITEQDNSYLIIDTKDPNRPRFTLNELQKVLMEKNQLTVKLDQTKDELEQLRRL